MTSRKPLFVTRPTLPPLSDLMPMLEEIWQSRILTNYGPLHRRFETALTQYLGVDHLSIVTNATLGLIVALRHVLRNAGAGAEVITTPFSFVASSHSILWAGAKPVFADIDPVTLNIDPAEVERRITPATKAILAVHCFGIPCDVAGLRAVAERHRLPLVYDAAHAFGVQVDGKSVLRHGDLSVLSFHATKMFNTVEGGAIVSRDQDTKIALDRLGNFGIADETSIPEVGMNTKMGELHAALGLAQLPHIAAAIEARRVVNTRYWEQFRDVPGIRCLCAPDRPGHNQYMFPILVEAAYPLSRDELYSRLRVYDIHARRYFHPLISDLPMYRENPSAQPALLPIARDAAARVLCLPLYPDLDAADQQRVIDLIRHP